MFFQSPITSYQLPVTNYQLPVTNYQLPVTNYQLPVTNYQHSTHIYSSKEIYAHHRRSPNFNHQSWRNVHGY
ncbi:hypothetical protein [Gloeocapsopsis sp. IPPAS B-1203]|uniref:hypothetical protein n=1 Tax=Gloeocapsopsis sp. IPPAS B-1203 TaxID=2049454 RepID=UPI00338D42EC